MNDLLSVIEIIAQKHPDIMGSVKEFSNSLPDDDQRSLILYNVGEGVGRRVFMKKYKPIKDDDFIAQSLKKIVLPSISPFSMAKIKDNEIHVSVCPFCFHIKEQQSSCQCHFLTGFICGLIGPEEVSVVEIQCRAQKNPACVFQVNKKY